MVPLAEFLQQPLPPLTPNPATMTLIVVKFLETHQKPPSFFDTDASTIDHRSIQQYQTMRICEVQMMGYRGMRLRICAMEFKCPQMREEDGTCVSIGRFRLRSRRYSSWGVETPLQEMNIRCRSFTTFKSLRRLFHIPTAVICHWAREGQHKLRMYPCGAVDAVVRVERYHRAEG